MEMDEFLSDEEFLRKRGYLLIDANAEPKVLFTLGGGKDGSQPLAWNVHRATYQRRKAMRYWIEQFESGAISEDEFTKMRLALDYDRKDEL